jgi:phenylpropionate dioxygenase-like ring-hydroxylating dioxygenase large terminal subunit
MATLAERPMTGAPTDPDADWSLPAWSYQDAEFAALEVERIFRPGWQVVCHLSDVPNAGDWHSLDYVGESVLVVRGNDGVVRAFTNVCRHRGSRLVDGSSGCAKKLICPYHAWTYELDGRLTGVPDSASYPSLDKGKAGLVPVDCEIWRGFIFVRLESGGPSVAEMMAPYEAMIAPYQFEKLEALGRVTLRPRTVNWKNVGDNYSDGLHIPVAHPGLTRLFGKSYGVEAETHVDRMWGDLEDRPSANWSERMYQKLLPPVPHLPESAQRHWLYFKLWPTVAFDIYPDQVDFMQWLPTGPDSCLIREISYVLPDAYTPDATRREMRAARYLNWRINRQVNAEDTVLITRVQEGMASRSFTVGPLSDKEVCLRGFAAKVRQLIPEARHHHAPPAGWSRTSTPES